MLTTLNNDEVSVKDAYSSLPQKLTEHLITKDEACNYIANFIQKFYPQGVRTVGGYISKSAFLDFGFSLEPTQTGTNYDGLLQWFCLDQQKPDELFLTFERERAYDKKQPYEKFALTESSRILKVPTELIRVSYEYSRRDVEDILIDGYYGESRIERNATEGEVNRMVSSFASHFSEYNKYPFGFFLKDEFDALLSQDEVIGVRYFFGFDPSLINKIRIVLVAVNKNWRNFINDSDPIILQKSIPPPPSNY